MSSCLWTVAQTAVLEKCFGSVRPHLAEVTKKGDIENI